MSLLDQIPARRPRSKTEMIAFLTDHFRYHTLNRCNRMTSYAHNVKIYNLPWKTREDESKAYELLSTVEAAQLVQRHSDNFARRVDYRYSIIGNGRSGGYLVLVESERKDSGYKSECPECGQLNFRLAPPAAATLDNLLVRHLLKGWTDDATLSEPEVSNFPATNAEKRAALIRLRFGCKDFSADSSCGKCGFERRENLAAPIYQTLIRFNGIDQNEDFSDWRKEDLRERTETVFLFDRTIKRLARAFVNFVETHRPATRTVYIPKIETIAAPVNSQ